MKDVISVDSFKKYQIIYADPPWKFSSRQKNTGRGNISLDDYHYPTMSLKDILNLDVKSVVDDNSVLLIWTTDAHLANCLEVIESWGFEYKTVAFNWLKKEKSGKQVCYMGMWTMKGSELCLLGTKGKAHSLLESRKVRQLVEAERTLHLSKPSEVYERIEQMFPTATKLELFARTKRSGWDSWGNEIESDIKL